MQINEIAIPQYWYRGIEHPIRPSQLDWKEKNLPPEVLKETSQYTDEVYRIHNYDFKISRIYRGMSNWGFGVYVTTDIAWASRYGSDIIVCEVDPRYVMRILHTDFVNHTPDTKGGRLADLLEEEVGHSYSEQAAIMAKMVRKIQKGAKALFVQTHADGSGQMCVFSKNYIEAKWFLRIDSK